MNRLSLSSPLTYRRFLHDEEGGNAIEFALVIPLFLVVIFAIMEYAHLFYVRSMVEYHTSSVARAAITGNNYGGASRLQYLRQQLENNLENNTALINMNAQTYNVQTSEPGILRRAMDDTITNNLTFGNSGEEVRYRAAYNYRFVTPLAQLLGLTLNETTVNIESIAYVWNEDY